NKGAVTVIDLAKRRRIKEIPIAGFAFSVALSPDGTVVVYGADEGLMVHDLTTGKSAKSPMAGGAGMRFSPDGRQFVSNAAGTLSVLDSKSLGVIVEKRAIGVQAGLSEISKNGKRLVVNALKDGKPGFKVFSLPELELVHEN